MIVNNELTKKEVYYYRQKKVEMEIEYRFFKHSKGWHFLVTYYVPNKPNHSVELDIPKEIIPTILLDKLDDVFSD